MAEPPSIDACNNAANDVAESPSSTAEVLQPRAFQYEMLEESLRNNIIVAMDTGSGKTLIAILRIQAELERASTEKLIWFLAPHVELATQQAKVIATQIPSVQTRLLLGADGVEHWTHHCIADHPASRILRDFYHPYLAASNGPVPAILGLTASPVVNSKIGRLEELEANLQAISRTPKLHREELLRYVHRPSLVRLTYAAPMLDEGTSQIASRLNQLRMSLDIEQDPYVKALRADPLSYDSQPLKKAILRRKTYCQEQLKRLNTKAKIIEDELGAWAADWYVDACTRKLQRGVNDESTSLRLLDDSEKVYLEQCLSTLISCISPKALLSLDSARLSPKFFRLIDFLISQRKSEFTGLLFVRTRAEVAVLSHILSMHQEIKEFYMVSTFVGISSSGQRKANVDELVDVRAQVDTLDDLRLGRKNLVVTTSALEEGIDVSACNTVVCFDKPSNLKSLIQRRGRARKSESTFAIMLAEDNDPSTIATWQQLEEKMQQQYMDDMRQLQELESLEAVDEGDREFVVETTGAKLLLSDAVSHLYHFCATLLSRQLSDPTPIFTFNDVSTHLGHRAVTSKVLLPICVDASVREACSRSAWITEKGAKRDAAFEAYIQLYRAKLISDNLLPIRGYDKAATEVESQVEKIASLVQVAGQLNPWSLAARQWQRFGDLSNLHCSEVSLHCDEKMVAELHMLTPCALPPIPIVTLFWDANTTFRATIRPSSPHFSRPISAESAVQSTALLLSSVFRSRMAAENADFMTLFIPPAVEDPIQWAERFRGTIRGNKLKEIDLSLLSLPKLGIIRDMSHGGVPHILRGFQEGSLDANDIELKPQDIENEDAAIWLQVSRFPKRTDFLHAIPEQNQMVHPRTYKTLLRSEDCEIDRLPLAYAYFAASVPAILHCVGVRLTAAHLSNTLLAPVAFKNMELVVTAIAASAAQEATNYQRQEFLGDSVLKFLTSLMLKGKHLHWHEGILSRAKDHIVSNASLAKAALVVGLDSFILTTPFTGSKWRPLYISEHLDNPNGKPRQLSTKTLADVVEALIGAAFLEGGFDKATAILKVLLPTVSWSPVEDCNSILHSTHQAPLAYPPHFAQLEQLIGYTFTLKSLPLEALTHSSYIGSNVSTSYERLEFLGDVCLDIIVATTAYNHEPPIPTHGLHLIRTAVVNAHFLAFLCLTLSISVPRTNITTGNKKNDVSMSETSVPIHIWNFMRHAAPIVRKSQQDCLKRYEALKTLILETLQKGSYIPWALLARLDAPKFFSDIIESLIGAIYIDSHGSLAACESFLETLGIMGYLRRLLQGGVALYHPKEELGQLADTENVRYEVFREEGEEK
ncbi:MAG: hypothetical protein Q9225_000568, partial [Loekoesia sp. 1 TL-2023]